MDNDNVYDEEFEDEIITLKNEDGEELEFRNIAGIALEEGYFILLQPVELFEDMADDEALVFEVVEDEDGNAQYSYVTDDSIIEKVFAEYDRLYDEALGKGDGE